MKKLLLFIALTIFGLGLNAQNVNSPFTIDYGDYTLKYSVYAYSSSYGTVSYRCTIIDCIINSQQMVDIVIPATITVDGMEGYVTSISYRTFYECLYLRSIKISNGITHIDQNAFEKCSNLENIEIPKSVTHIGSHAFCGCSNLTDVVFENNSQLASVEECVFMDCSSLKNVDFGENSQISTMEYYAFYDCSSLTNIEIPSNVTIIDNSFYGCDNLKNVTFEEKSNLTTIGERAFAWCPSLTSIEIPNSVTSIGEEAFEGCSSLTSIEIPGSVTSIGDNAFWECGLTRIICYSEIVPTIGENVFYSNYTNVIYVPKESVETYQNAERWNEYDIIGIGNVGYCEIYDFENYSLKFTITSNEPAECEVVCTKQPTTPTAITIPSLVEISGMEYSVTSIGDRAFEYSISETSCITDIQLPFTITSIGASAFFGCDVLTNIEIPNEVTSIGIGAFNYCSNLQNIEIPENVTYIEQSQFGGCVSLKSITVDINNTVFDSRNNCNALIETSTNTIIGACSNTIIPNNVTHIGKGAFADHDEITNIVIPNNIVSIGYMAFYNCDNLKSVIFEEKSQLNYIEALVFSLCGLTNIDLGNASNLDSLNLGSFSNSRELIDIVLPNNISYVGGGFYDTPKLKKITCHAENVPETESYAFDDCPSDMTIYVPEVSLEDYKSTSPWNAFTILPLNDDGNDPLDAPENLIANVLSTSSISLSWDAVENALSYNVYQANELIANVEETTFTVDGLEYNTEYCYTVTAVRNDEESDKSKEKCAKTFDLPITTPENLVAEALSTLSIILTWDNVENALSYNVYQANELIANVEETTFTVDSLEYNTEYCYTVTAVRNETESDKSEEKCVKTLDLPITTPENLVAEALSTSSISLSWDAVENALSYNVYQANEMIANVEETTFTVDGLEYNTEYCYTVTAVCNETESDKSEEKCVKTLGEKLEELSSSSINIYPNPVENELFLATEVRVNEVSIYDIYGRLCCRDASNASTSNSMDTFNVSVQDLEAGIYFVNIKTENGNIVKRFVKK